MRIFITIYSKHFDREIFVIIGTYSTPPLTTQQKMYGMHWTIVSILTRSLKIYLTLYTKKVGMEETDICEIIHIISYMPHATYNVFGLLILTFWN